MNWMENLLIIAGVSLDIFAAMECQGSLVKKINKKQLSAICVVIVIGQLIGLFLGYFLSDLFCRKYAVANEKMLGEIIAMLIFFTLGIRLITKAIRNERIEERLENNLGIKRFVQMTARTGIYTILVGIAFGFLGTNTVLLLIMMIVFTIAFVIGGMYTGYHMGFDSKTMVYAVGAVLLWISGFDVLLRRVLDIF